MMKIKLTLVTSLFLILILFCCESDVSDGSNLDDKARLTISKNIPFIKNSSLGIIENLDLFLKIFDDNNQRVNSEIFNIQIENQNDFATINLEIKESYRNDFEMSSGGSSFSVEFFICNLLFDLDQIGENESDQIDMLEILCNNSEYNISNSEVVTIPLSFYFLEDSGFTRVNSTSLESRLLERVDKTNQDFIEAKIQFSIKEIDIFSANHFPGYNVLDQSRADESNMPYDNGAINIYIADLIGSSLDCSGIFNGIAQFPDSSIRTNRIFLETKALLDFFDPNGFLLSHELGHTFSLYHNFQSNPPNGFTGCSDNICLNSEDTVCDTILGSNPLDQTLGCDDPRVRNIMSYSPSTHPNCVDHEFTDDQNQRMRFAAEYWYYDLFTDDSPIDDSLNFFGYEGVVFEEPTPFVNPTFSQNGLHMYAVSDGKIVHYNLAEKYNLDNVNSPEELEIIANGSNRVAKDVVINSDGTALYVKADYINFGNSLWLQYELSSPYILSSATLIDQTEFFYTNYNLQLSSDDLYLYMTRWSQGAGQKIYPYEFTNGNLVSSLQISPNSSISYGTNSFAFRPAIGISGNSIILSTTVGPNTVLHRYTLSPPWDLTSMEISPQSELNPNINYTSFKVEFYDDEDKIFFISTSQDGVFKLHRYQR